MVGLIAYILVDGDWVDASAIVLKNGYVGPPGPDIFLALSVTANFDGRAIADIYNLEISSVVASTSGLIKVTCGSASNPYNDQVGVTVNLDNTTEYTDIIPGVTLVFFTNAIEGLTASIQVGQPFGGFNAFPPDSGDPSDPVRVKVVNTGTADGSACSARLLPNLKRVKKTGIVFAAIHGPAEGATEKLSGEQVAPYGVVVSNVTGVGPAKTMDVRVDGNTFNVINLTDSSTSASTGLNVVDFYRATDGDLEGMEFQLSEDAVNSDEENVLCFSQRFSQLSADFDGIPGDWGLDDIVLTEDGQNDGVISAGGAAYFWVRVLAVDGGNSSSNPYIVDVAIEGTAESAAGWTD